MLLRDENNIELLEMLRKCCNSNILAIPSLICSFQLLDCFLIEKSNLAPYVYKTLILSLISNHENIEIRKFMEKNLSLLLQRHPNLPVYILLEPYIAHYNKSLISEHAIVSYKELNYNFIVLLASHPSLTLKYALLLLHFLGTIILKAINNDDIILPAEIFLILINRYRNEQILQQYTIRFVQVIFTEFMNIVTNETVISRTKLDTNFINKNDIYQPMHILLKLSNMRLPWLISAIEGMLKSVIADFNEIYNYTHPQLSQLILFFHNENSNNKIINQQDIDWDNNLFFDDHDNQINQFSVENNNNQRNSINKSNIKLEQNKMKKKKK